MKALQQRLAVTLAVAFVFYALAAPLAQDGTVLATALVLAASIALGARYLAISNTAGEIRVGARSKAHREVLSQAIEPQHPNTEGRPRTRAPSQARATA